MKSKIKQNKILKKGILFLLLVTLILPSSIHAAVDLTLQASTAIEKLMYGEVGSVVRKIEEHFKSNTTLYIVNEIQLRALAEYVNSGKSCLGKEIVLLNDIKIDGNIDWNPIGNATCEFAGTFDGKGRTITNLTYTGYNNYTTGFVDAINPDVYEMSHKRNIGLFGIIAEKGIVKNLVVNNSSIYSKKDNINGHQENIGNVAGVNYRYY